MATDNGEIGAGEPNRDPLTGAPGAHPVGTGAGAAGLGVAGGLVGALGGPVGAAIGMVAGAVLGGLTGKAVAENVNPTQEDAYWREHYASEAYVDVGRAYDDYRPAYEMGWSGRAQGGDFDAVEPTLGDQWASRRGSSTLSWDEARPATRAAWERADATYFARPAHGPALVDNLPNEQVVEVLNDLLQNARDGEYGFRTCAEQVETERARSLFARRAEDCRVAGLELMEMIRLYGGEPAAGGSAAGAVHRGWVQAKGSVGADSEQAMLESCERGEDAAVARYRKALTLSLPRDAHALVQRQARGAQANHDAIRDLRNAARAAAH